MTVDPFENFKKNKSADDKLGRKNLPQDNVGKVSNYFTVPKAIRKEPAPESTEPEVAKKSGNSAVKRLEALTQLLIRKGVITEEELKMMSDLLDR